MVRNNRQLIRLFFILVLAMALFGGYTASRSWQRQVAQFDNVDLSSLSNRKGDWVDFVSSLGEGAIQLFLGLTSGKE